MKPRSDVERGATLLELGADLERIEQEIVAAGGALTPELEARFDAAALALVAKVDAFACYAINLKGRADKVRELCGVMRKRADAMDAHYERLMKYADVAIGDERKSLVGDAFELVRVKNPGKIEITSDQAVAAYCPEAVRWEPLEAPHRIVDGKVELARIDKSVVREVAKRNGHLPGVTLIEGFRVEIR